MMSIPCTYGYEFKAKNCGVSYVFRNGKMVHFGSYVSCVCWLSARGITFNG